MHELHWHLTDARDALIMGEPVSATSAQESPAHDEI